MIAYGRTGFPVSPICLGTSNWGPVRADESGESRDARLSSLGKQFLVGRWPSNFIDTSNNYGKGQSEGFIGRSLKATGGIPDGLVIQTKLDRDAETGDFGADRMWRSLDESLNRLGLDKVQVLFLHDPHDIGFTAAMAPGGPVEALVAMKSQGLAEFIGISDGPLTTLAQFIETDLFDAVITHNRFTLIDRSADSLLDLATEHGMGVTNAAPYGGGILTGDPRFGSRYGYVPVQDEVRLAVAKMADLCKAANVPLAAAALQFSLRDARIHSTVVGASSLDRFDEAMEYSQVTIPADLWSELDRVAPRGFALDSLIA